MRSSFRKKIIYGIVIGAALGSLVFFSESALVRRIRGAAVWVTKPLMRSGTALRQKIFFRRGIVFREEDLRSPEGERRLQALGAIGQEWEERLARLEKVLHFQERIHITFEGARIFLLHRAWGKEYLMIDRGDESGVQEGQLALDSDGMVVGLVKEVGNHFSKISIASNAESVFEVEVVPLGIRGLAKGLGARTFSIELIPAAAPLRKGDFAMAALGDASRRGVLAQIVSIQQRGVSAFQEVRAVLVAQPELLQEVFLVAPSPLEKKTRNE